MGSPEEADAALNNLESYCFEDELCTKKKKPSPPPPLMPGPTFNLFVANLPFEAKSKDLKEFFIAEGADVVSAEVIFQDNPWRSTGYGLVAFKTRKEAEEALSTFSAKISSRELGGGGVYDRGSIFLQNSHKENSKILQNDIGCLEIYSNKDHTPATPIKAPATVALFKPAALGDGGEAALGDGGEAALGDGGEAEEPGEPAGGGELAGDEGGGVDGAGTGGEGVGAWVGEGVGVVGTAGAGDGDLAGEGPGA
ncbi:hypothetical protein NC653_006061 [Populus alba x Populus x berolinensis]|uniref:RRM domain-containing protein n=1 Tax=Populus alba x Populus x berolinensis TaxID=444605 RepID=A0AAD6RDV8_9ROSI|nr:hypothetical protein NC653_006061 [Populus alba x Populus x berolinensis]